MLRFLCILSLSFLVHAKYETLSDIQTLFDDPELFRELEKRLGILPDDDVEDSQTEPGEDSVLPVACFALSGTLQADCDFRASNNSIIKTKESMIRGAEFLQDFSNFSCAKDCTAECCANPECDTAVYQDKEERNCYLFQCRGECVFAQHGDYWMSTITKAAHNSHIPAIGEATNTHENELHGLQGSRDKEPVDVPKVQSTTTVQTTTVAKPALGDRCGSYHTECEDPHAECMFHKCQCKVAMGYHAKHGICRKRCRNTEFECDNEGYGPGVTQCVHKSYVCDGNQDCPDNSDEYVCPDKNQDGNPGIERPNFVHSSDNKQTGQNSGNSQRHAGHSDIEDHIIQQTEPPSTETTTTSTTTTSPPVVPDEDKSSSADTGSAESSASQTSDDNDQKESKDTEPDSKDSDSQSKEDAPKVNNKTEAGSEVKEDETEDNDNGSEKGHGFDLFTSEQVEVVSYTDNIQGPIIALALGLAITTIMLIFVGCRLRNVKRRLRKGRALHSNEADYLINGMYL